LRRTFLGWEIIESEKRTGEELAYISKTTWNKLFRKTKSYVISDNQWRLSSIGWKSRNRKSEKRIDYWDPGDRLSRRKTFYRYKYNSYGQVTEELMSTDKRRYVNSKTIYFYEYY
jgi:YD repeat-containing protein